MPLLRRNFLAGAAGGLAAAALSRRLVGADTPAAVVKEPPLSELATKRPSLFLTWWTDPTTTMVIQWVAPATTTIVHYAPHHDSAVWQSAQIEQRPFPDTDLFVHRCELTGLQPGTEYKFRIGEAVFEQRFRTMPDKATDTFQFVSGGDCGTGEHAIGTNKLAARQEPHFALIGGDLAYDNGKSPKTFLQFLQNYSKHMVDPEGRMIPLLSCLGNHEVKTGYKGKREDAPHYLSVFDGLYRDTSYGVMDFGDYLSLVLLDTGHLSPIAGAQTDWLGQTLADRQSRAHLIVANHVPAYPSYRPSDDTGLGNREHWRPLFEKFNVDVVLEHHDHTFKRTHPLKDGLKDKYGVVYLGDGSWGKLRALNKPERRPYLAAWGESNHITVHRLEGDQRFHIAVEESGKVADVCMTTSKRPARRG